MPVTLGLVGAGVNAFGGLIKGLVGSGQKHKGDKLLKNLQYPTEQVPTEITNAAATGMPSEQYGQAMQNIQRQQLMALRGAHDRRGGLGLISGIQQGTNDATLGLDVKNAQIKQQNQFKLASWKDKVWQNNVKDKYTRDYSYAMGLKGVGNQNLVGGLDQLGAAGGMAAMGLFGTGSNRNNNTGYSDYSGAGGGAG